MGRLALLRAAILGALFALPGATALAQAAPEPQPLAPAQPPPLPPPSFGAPAPQQPPPPLPPPSWAPLPGSAPVIVMPPGYLEEPGRWPRKLKIEERGAPPPLGYHLSRDARRPLWATGTALFTAGHAVTGLVAGGLLASHGESVDGVLFVPILGPIIWAPMKQPLDTEDGRGLFAGMAIVTATQATGFALLIAGLVFKEPIYVRNDVFAKAEPRPIFSAGLDGVSAGVAF